MLYYLNFSKFESMSTVIHNAPMNDWFFEKCNFTKLPIDGKINQELFDKILVSFVSSRSSVLSPTLLPTLYEMGE